MKMAEPILAAGSTWFTQGGTTVKRASITEIEIKDSYTPAGAVTASWDASAAKDGSVMAYVEGTNLIIAGNGSGKVFANPNSSYAFSDSAKKDYYTKLTKIAGGNLLDTSKATTMANMFRQSTITSIDTSSWDTSKVESLYCMFYDCMSLTTLDVSNWDTSSVTDMTAMFNMRNANPNTKLVALDVSNWDVRNVQSTAKMFYNCLALHDLVGLGNWQTSSLTECNSMFSSGSSNTGNMPFDTQDLAVGNWDMSDVTNAGYMFYGCGSLEEIDLSNWDTSNMETFHHFFCDCYNLKKVNFSGWDTSKVTTYDAMFNHCISLEVLDLSSFDTSACTDMAQMFEICESLKTIYVGDGWDTSNIIYSFEIFSGCKTLVGGAGTTFQGSDLKYAHVDGGEENPGYLTYKAPETTNP
jgi:surface protein